MRYCVWLREGMILVNLLNVYKNVISPF